VDVAAALFLQTLQKLHDVEITGVEGDPFLLEFAQRRLNGTFFLADPTQLDFLEQEQFDFVSSFNLFQYFTSKEEIRRAFYHLARLAKLNAHILVGFVNDKSKETSVFFDEKCPKNIFLDKDFWRDLAWGFGLEDLKVVKESQIQNTWFGGGMPGSWYQYSVYCRKGGIIHG